MKLVKNILIATSLLVLSALALANVRRPIPPFDGPVYVGAMTAYILSDGSHFFIEDDGWAAISFVRPLSVIPPNTDLLSFDFGAIGQPLLVEGFGIFRTEQSNVPLITQMRGVVPVPVWFVRVEELEAAMADDVLLFSELESLPSLIRGSADNYEEQNHFTTHQKSHLATVATGTLEDGRRFRVNAVEVGLRLVQCEIRFE